MSIRVGIRPMGRTLRGVLCPKPKRIECSIFSAYSLCTLPTEEIVAQPTSIYVLCIEQKEYLTASLASTYSLTVT